jgi:hypothetical protein
VTGGIPQPNAQEASMNRKDQHSDRDDSQDDAGAQGSGKVAQAHNSAGDKPATQLHQGRRTPESRGDRDAHVGSGNQMQSRQGAAGSSSGGGSRGAG